MAATQDTKTASSIVPTNCQPPQPSMTVQEQPPRESLKLQFKVPKTVQKSSIKQQETLRRSHVNSNGLKQHQYAQKTPRSSVRSHHHQTGLNQNNQQHQFHLNSQFLSHYASRVRQRENGLWLSWSHFSQRKIDEVTCSNNNNDQSNNDVIVLGSGRRTSRKVLVVEHSDSDDDDDIDFDNDDNNNEQASVEKILVARRVNYTDHLIRDERSLNILANSLEVLVPITLDIEIDAENRIKDSFTWDLSDTLMTPEKFAEIMCYDLDLSNTHTMQRSIPMHRQIADSIRTQLQEFIRLQPFIISVPSDFCLIELNVQVGRLVLMDSFQWDMSDENHTTPEEFSMMLCNEVGLGSEFMVSIATSIRAQILKHKYSTESADSNFKQESIRRVDITVPETLARPGVQYQVDEYSPRVVELSMQEMEQNWKHDERESRRNRRESNRVMANTSSGKRKSYGGHYRS